MNLRIFADQTLAPSLLLVDRQHLNQACRVQFCIWQLVQLPKSENEEISTRLPRHFSYETTSPTCLFGFFSLAEGIVARPNNQKERETLSTTSPNGSVRDLRNGTSISIGARFGTRVFQNSESSERIGRLPSKG